MDETQRFPGEPVVGGHRLTACWGPATWRLGPPPRLGFVGFAYAPDGESIWYVRAGELTLLDREGHVRAQHALPGEVSFVVLAADAPRAAYVDATSLVVIELPTMREVMRVPGKGTPLISANGEVAAAAGEVWRVGEASPIAHWPHLQSLSPDGGHVVLMEAEGGHLTHVTLMRVGGEPIRETTGWLVSGEVAWSDDGRVAVGARSSVLVWSVHDPAAETTLRVEQHGAMCFAGEALLVSELGELLRVTVSEKHRLGPGSVLAITRDRSRALVWGPPPFELDLSSDGRRHGPASPPLRDVTRIVWDHASRSALVLRADGDLRLWDAERWCTERVIDADRTLLTRTPVKELFSWTFERVWLAFSRDDRRLIVLDAAARLSILSREGERITSVVVSPPAEWPASPRSGDHYSVHHCVLRETDEGIEVHTSWQWMKWGAGGYGEHDYEDRRLCHVLTSDGALVPRPELAAPISSGMRVEVRRGPLYGVDIGAAWMPIERAVHGEAHLVAQSPDGRMLLVATATANLLRYDRVP